MCFWRDFGGSPSQLSEADSTDDAHSDDGMDDTSETAPILPDSTKQPIKTIARHLYVSHFLSTWNSRMFEFGAVLYLANIFPDTLMPLSIYAVARGASAIIFGSLIGQVIDKCDRLVVVRLSILLQRSVVAASCAVFWVLARGLLDGEGWKFGLLGLLTVLACVEKVASIMNLVSVERDWVVTIAQDDRDHLPVINSQMRRIDLICKLLGPFSIALVDGVSTEVAILVNLGINLASVPVEYLFIAQIYHRVPQLQRHTVSGDQAETEGAPEDQERRDHIHGHLRKLYNGLSKMGQDTKLYIKHRAFLPSFACALLYLTVLSFSGQMVTHLLSSGFTSTQVAVARNVSVCFEVLATWVGPWLMSKIGAVRAGLWFASWQSGCLLVGMSMFWSFKGHEFASASALVGSTIMSRLGLWGFDLCAQIIIQEEVEEDSRGAFSTSEAAWQNAFELLSYASTIVFSRPEQFGIPVSISVLAVLSAWLLYSRFLVQRRGHLLHLPSCLPEKRESSFEDAVVRLQQRRYVGSDRGLLEAFP